MDSYITCYTSDNNIVMSYIYIELSCWRLKHANILYIHIIYSQWWPQAVLRRARWFGNGLCLLHMHMCQIVAGRCTHVTDFCSLNVHEPAGSYIAQAFSFLPCIAGLEINWPAGLPLTNQRLVRASMQPTNRNFHQQYNLL